MMCRSLLMFLLVLSSISYADKIRELQSEAAEKNEAAWGHWGWEADNYRLWSTHSNRLIPVYTFGTLDAGDGIDLRDYTGENSPYRSPAAIRNLYDYVPAGTVNPNAEYCDQTNIADIQFSALTAGKKHIILVVFDGMDWETTRAAAIANKNAVLYDSGRGTGVHFQDYKAGGNTQFGAMVTSPHNDGTKTDVNTQTISNIYGAPRGGYAFEAAGSTPWDEPNEIKYLVTKSAVSELQQAYTDSASSATSMTAGVKTYNASVNIDARGEQVQTVAHLAQQLNYKVGVVTSVPISHATPAAAYAHNVKRHDYQDLTRDLIGRPSISHPDQPLPGLDVLIGCGFGEERAKDSGQGDNFVPGNSYLALEDLQAIDVRNGGKYLVSQRAEGVVGAAQLQEHAQTAAEKSQRLFGFYGVKKGHLPFQTADGQYDPPAGKGKAEVYSEADIKENPNLAQMTEAALTVLSANDQPFWLMVEAGDVDWANHDNNVDNSIGATLSGDAAVKTLTDWVEANSSWDETVMIVTADHGHMLVLTDPSALTTDSN